MKYKLSEIGRIVTGKTPSTKNKTSFSEEPDKYLFVTPRDMNGSEKTIKETERYLTDEVTNTFKTLVINEKSICVSCIGTIGKVFMPSGPAITNQQINSITEIKNFVLPDYLYYYLTIHQKDIENLAGGTTMPIVNKTSFEQLEVEIPDLKTQKKIVRILSALDQKIELNNQQSKALETVAFALYDDLINNIDESDFKKVAIGQIADCKLGGTPSRAKTEYWGGSINWINSGAINSFRITGPSELITEEGFKHTSTYMLPKGTTVLAITGATLGQVSRMEIEGCANQSVIGIVGNNAISNEYIYLTIVRNIQEIINRQTGGAQQHINKNDIKEFEIILPNQQLMNNFTNKVRPIFEKIAQNEFENKTLSSVRDAILPELVSGEINLNEATINE